MSAAWYSVLLAIWKLDQPTESWPGFFASRSMLRQPQFAVSLSELSVHTASLHSALRIVQSTITWLSYATSRYRRMSSCERSEPELTFRADDDALPAAASAAAAAAASTEGRRAAEDASATSASAEAHSAPRRTRLLLGDRSDGARSGAASISTRSNHTRVTTRLSSSV